MSGSIDKSRDSTPLSQRRGFLAKLTALIVGCVVLLTPAAVGIIAFLNPLKQKSRAGGFIRVTNLDALPEDGSPQKFPVIADRTDAWNFFPNVPVGAVYLRRAGKDRVEALQVVCPHAGCSIGIEAAGNGKKYFCPCHAASFDLAGKRLDADSPSPRAMDSLETEIRNNNEVWVKFQNFITGAANKMVSG
ncbi:MAG: Rieske 2Fe-2S domain-containing protein [Thermoguttaceae bacterium]|jgi:Rieske Fe-S protein